MKKFKHIIVIALVVLMATPVLAQEMPKFDMDASIAFLVLGEHSETDRNGSTSKDDYLGGMFGPPSMITFTGTYGEATATIGLRPFDSYLVDRVYLTYNTFEKQKFVIGVAPSEASYSFGDTNLKGVQLEGYGATQQVRRLMLRYHFEDFTIALVDGSMSTIARQTTYDWIPRDNAATYFKTGVPAGVTWIDNSIPRIEATYKINAGAFKGKLYGQYGAYLFDAVVNNHKSSNIVHLGIIGLGGQYDIDNVRIRMNVYGGLNGYLNTALFNRSSDYAPKFILEGNEYKIADSIEYGAAAEFSYKFNKTTMLNVGLGYAIVDNSDANSKKNALGSYVNTDFVIAKGVIITPELAYYNNDDKIGANKTEKSELWYGVRATLLLF